MNDTVHEIELAGCTPTPLSSYLKALAVLRLVAEQGGDPQVRGCWRDDVFVLRTRLGRDELLRFFLEDYAPTPLVAPWGARSGFYDGSAEATARETLQSLDASDAKRLTPFKEAITAVRSLLVKHGIGEKPTDEQKLELLRICRNELPEQLLRWLGKR